MELIRLIRYLRGERPGMSAGAVSPTPTSFLYYPITLQTQVHLADVSFWQEDIDFDKMRASGIDGVIIRAGQRNWTDCRFRENWTKAREAGLPRGSYWLYDSRADPKAQAALWWSLIQSDPGELVHAADLEESYGGPYGLPSHFRTFIQEFQRLSGLPDDRIVVYTGYFWWTQRVGNDSFFRRFAIWIAWYASMNVVRVPPPWIESDLFAWQYTSHGDGPLHGVSSLNIDLNWYCCDPRTFSLRFHLGAPNPDEETMYYYKWTATGANIRKGPGSGFQDLGDIVRDDVVSAEAPISGAWVNITDALHRDGTPVILADGSKVSDHFDCWMTTSYLVQVDGFPVPPPPPPTPSHVVEVVIDGVVEFRKEF